MNYELTYGCIGEHLPHSFSKEIHGQIGGYAYELKELTPEELPAFMAARSFRGINVTIPYKQAVIPFLDEIDETARAIGAINTVVNRNGKLYGFNTDLDGLTRLIRRIGLDLSGKKVLIPGTGGTSRTAAFAAEKLGAREIHKISRTGRDGSLTYEEALRVHTDAEIILNTTPCGMYPEPDARPLPLEPFHRLEGVADVIYNPLRTRLVLDARSRGIPAEGGLYMLVAQAVRASEHFLDTAYPDGLTDRIHEQILRQKENIVLIGMPGSGKTVIGRKLAELTGKQFRDSDACLQETYGKTAEEIILSEGEDVFRTYETAIIETLAKEGGQVIATGGGVVEREENRNLLLSNGRIVYIRRDLDKLPAGGRPISRAEGVQNIFERRRERYESWQDLTVENHEINETADEIKEKLGY